MNLKIDVRESELIKKIQYYILNIPAYHNIQLTIESLPLGDIIINNGKNDNGINDNGKNDIIIIERKSINDLAASIKDGRYEEQSYRLNGLEIHNHNIIYLIEGNINHPLFKDRFDKSTIYSAIFSILYYKGFSILRSSDLDETANILCNMITKIVRMKDKEGFYSLKNTNTNNNHILLEEDGKEYCKVIKKIKKDNITSENIGEIMLSQIPGISSNTAIAILQKHKSISNLIKNIQQDDKCLKDICIVDKNNKSRKINKTCIENIIKFLK
jgi:ERCC4-type nuclease